jgi:heptosyltransferase-1
VLFRSRKPLLVPACLSEAAAPLLRFAARRWVRERPSPPSAFRHVLVVGSNHLGDVLMRTGSLPALRRGLPKARISYLTSRVGEEILHGNPHVDFILPWHESDDPLGLPSRVMDDLRAQRFDAVIVGNCIRYWPFLVLALRLGIPNRAAYVAKGFSGLVTHPLPLRFPDTHPAYFADIVSDLGGVPREWSLAPQLFPTSDDLARAEEFLAGHPHLRERAFVVLACTWRQTAETWPRESWARLAALLVAGGDVSVVLSGAPEDREVLESISALANGTGLVAAGGLSPRALAVLLGRAAALITLDSGPRHLGNAVGVPVIYFRNLTGFAREHAPYCATEQDAVGGSAERLPAADQRAVLRSITPERVLRMVTEAVRSRAMSGQQSLQR